MNNKSFKYALWTNDVETTSIWYNSLRDDTALKVYKEGMPLLLDIYKKYNIQSTFFFTGYIANLIPDIVKMIVKDGHEVASHGLSHKKENGFDVMTFEKQLLHLNESKKILEDISGKEVISFRAPALRTNKDTVSALIAAGYKIDSSIASQRFDAFMSFGSLQKLKWLTAPRLPYKTSSQSLAQKGVGPIIEVPLSALIFPYVGTTMRAFPLLTGIQRRILFLENKINRKPIVFDIHPNEFIDESNMHRVISKRSSNFFSYLIQDLVRSQIKIKNIGISGTNLYEKEIAYFHHRNFVSCTLREYLNKIGLLT